MTTEARIYIVKDRLNQSTRLVRAGNPAQALRFVANDQFVVAPAKTNDLAALLGTSIQVENATLTLEAVHSGDAEAA
jgi:hypothetical protein